VEEIRVASWAELQEHLFADSWNDELQRHRSNYGFRGRGDATDDLVTSLLKLGGDAAQLERHLIRNFRKYAARDAVPVDTPWNWLALGQHYGLPTRLLDWTFSPYVALHFATAAVDGFDRDGVVWMVDYVRAHELAPDALRDELEAEGANVFTTEMLASVAKDFEDLPRGGDEFVLFVEPPSFDERIVNQYALFSLLSSPELPFAAWLDSHPDLARRVVIPSELKAEVRDKLDQAGVNERVLFPGLEGLTRWVTRYYAPPPRKTP
jgi:FRG domain